MPYIQKHVPRVKKKYAASEKNEIDVRAVNMNTKINEAKTLVKHISCDCKYKFDSTTCNSNRKWNSELCQCECKNYRTSKKIKVGIIVHVFVRVASISKVNLMIQQFCAMKL